LTWGFPASSSGFKKSPCKLSVRSAIFEARRSCRRRQTKESSTRLKNTNTTEIAIPALAPGASPALPLDIDPLAEIIGLELEPKVDVVLSSSLSIEPVKLWCLGIGSRHCMHKSKACLRNQRLIPVRA
jgi:hypothetical protein